MIVGSDLWYYGAAGTMAYSLWVSRLKFREPTARDLADVQGFDLDYRQQRRRCLEAAGLAKPPPEPRHVAQISPSATATDRFKTLQIAAMAGDYQAQRNLAYTLSQRKPPDQVLACAWRMIIMSSNSPQRDSSDASNQWFDCDKKLSAEQQGVAQARAVEIMDKMTHGR